MSETNDGSSVAIESASKADLQLAAELLLKAKEILLHESYPFPVLEAARRLKIDQASVAFSAAAEAREIIGRERNEKNLTAAADLLLSEAEGMSEG